MGALQEEAEEAEVLRSPRTALVEEAGAEGEAAEVGELPRKQMTVRSTLRRDGEQKSDGRQTSHPVSYAFQPLSVVTS